MCYAGVVQFPLKGIHGLMSSTRRLLKVRRVKGERYKGNNVYIWDLHFPKI